MRHPEKAARRQSRGSAEANVNKQGETLPQSRQNEWALQSLDFTPGRLTRHPAPRTESGFVSLSRQLCGTLLQSDRTQVYKPASRLHGEPSGWPQPSPSSPRPTHTVTEEVNGQARR